jgi:hypothetical protein
VTALLIVVAVVVALVAAARSGRLAWLGGARPGLLERAASGLAWLGGARPGLLERAAVDSPAFTGRGIAAVIPALFGSLAMTTALEYGQQLGLIPAAAGGLAWGMIILLFDLSVMSADVGGNSAWSWLRGMAFLAVRAAASILAALVISSMIALFWYRTDIATQVNRNDQASALAYDRKYIDPRYTPQITQDKAQVAADQARLNADAQTVTSDSNAVSRAKVLMQCEKGGVSDLAGCPAGSGDTGEGPVYAARVAEYQEAQDVLAKAVTTQQMDKARLLPEISRDQADAAALQDKQNRAEAAELAFQASHDGLLARQRALSELEAANPGVGAAVKVMELLIVIIDCSAVIAKITSRTPAYDRVVQAEKNGAIWHAERDERFYREWWQAIADVEKAWIGAWRDANLGPPGRAGQGSAMPAGGPAGPAASPPAAPGAPAAAPGNPLAGSPDTPGRAGQESAMPAGGPAGPAASPPAAPGAPAAAHGHPGLGVCPLCSGTGTVLETIEP